MHRSSFRGRRLVALPAAVLALVIGASPVLGLSFGAVRTIATAGSLSGPQAIAAVGGTVHSAYSEGGLIKYRRSLNGGSTWQTVQPLTSLSLNSNGFLARVAASGQRVLVLWMRYKVNGSRQLLVRRSSNGGDTWGATTILVKFSTGTDLTDGTIAITGQRALAAWTDGATGAVHIRRSTDGGGTWQGASTLAATTQRLYPGGPFTSNVTAAAADGRIFVVFVPAQDGDGHPVGMRMRRTADGGESWGGAPYIHNYTLFSGSPVSMSASGARLILAYRYFDGRIVVSHSDDRGATWIHVYATGETTTGMIGTALVGQRARIVYSTMPDGDTLLYRSSNTAGHVWSAVHEVARVTLDLVHVAVALGSGGTVFAWGENLPAHASGILHTRHGQ